jgi:2-C-methyl-D-erythritol 4-phosphate cytidylyltransferase
MLQNIERNCPVYVVIPAAGAGSRMQSKQNKQFLQLGRYPAIIRTLRIFETHPAISGCVVAAAAGELDEMRRLTVEYGLTKCLALTAGGSSRLQSVANGLAALGDQVDDLDNSLILVHDGARCFVTPDIIDRVVAGIYKYQACGAAIAVKDTIKRADAGGLVLETLDRSQLRALQTPQGAFYPLLRAAFDRALLEGWPATDDLAVLEMAGIPVHLVAGNERNIKLTTPEDLLLAQQLASLLDKAEN